MLYSTIRNNTEYKAEILGRNGLNTLSIDNKKGVINKYTLSRTDIRVGTKTVYVHFHKEVTDLEGAVYSRDKIVFNATLQADFAYFFDISRNGEEQIKMCMNGLLIYLENFFIFAPTGEIIPGGLNLI